MSFLETCWATAPLGRVVKFNARTLPETTAPGFEFRYVDISSVGRGELVEEPQVLTFENSPSRARRILRPGDTIVSTVRTYLRAVMRVPDNATDLIGSTGFAVLTARSQLDSQFLSWFAQSHPFIEEVVARSVGVSYPAISPFELARLPVPVPDITVQRAVADFLDFETTRIDRLAGRSAYGRGEQPKGVLGRLEKLLAEKRVALITAAVTGQIEVPEVVKDRDSV